MKTKGKVLEFMMRSKPIEYENKSVFRYFFKIRFSQYKNMLLISRQKHASNNMSQTTSGGNILDPLF